MARPRRRYIDWRRYAVLGIGAILVVALCIVVIVRYQHASTTDHAAAPTPIAPAATVVAPAAPAPRASAAAADPLLFSADDTRLTTVVNKKHAIAPIDYTPGTLTHVGSQELRTEAAAAVQAMQAASSYVVLEPGSGFRSYQYQQGTYGNLVATYGQQYADEFSARPGYSEHQLGLAIDFLPINGAFETTPAFAWLSENGHRYGFILRYPRGKEQITGYSYEPWHWRYVGVETATAMHDRGIATLEEFFGVEGGGY